MTAEHIADKVCYLINHSINSGKFPTLWKCAKVIALHKGGATDNLDNYRPISILCAISKILERHVHDAFFAFLKDHELISDRQSGFMKFNSCETGLTGLLNKWLRAIDDGDIIAVVNIDLRKAFNLINHDVMLAKLELYGCSNETIEWFDSYLRERTQFVKFCNASSGFETCNYGVPQGSILGPLLFIVYYK